MLSRTLIYALFDPSGDSPRIYVGKTSRDLKWRLSGHMTASRSKDGRLVSNWISSLSERGIKPSAALLETVPADGDWAEAEAFWIASLRSIGIPLANLTDGGEGNVGWKWNAKIRASRPNDVAWDSVGLGTRKDSEIASEFGVSIAAVCAARKRRGIPVFTEEVDWSTERDLGMTWDARLAKKHGITRGAVVKARIRAGLPAYTETRNCAFCGREFLAIREVHRLCSMRCIEARRPPRIKKKDSTHVSDNHGQRSLF